MPWCISKCPYCDFNSHALHGELPEEAYIDALGRDLADEKDYATGRPIQSIFIGGGTPSVFSGKAIGRLLDAVRTELPVQADCEITMEANPGTVEHGALADYRAAGVNRLSIGVQSFDAGHLQVLGRLHDGEQAQRAFDEARAAGFDNINLDLMYALPDQSVAQALNDVAIACELQPEHLSHYQLTIEPNTVFYASPPRLPDDDLSWEMLGTTERHLGDNGYRRYEVSAFCRPGRESRHNLNYWRFGDYLAVGAGAHGKVTTDSGEVLRYAKPANPRAYLQAMQSPARVRTGTERIDSVRQVFEFMLNAVRLCDGFSLADLPLHDDAAREHLDRGLARAEKKGLLRQLDEGSWRPTELGFRFLNDLQLLFLP